ncbi:MAG: sodium:solute symporter [Phycisphaerales bacterium]
MPQLAQTFMWLDWLIVGVYMSVVIVIGVMVSRRGRGAGSDEMILAGRSMPMWAVAISVLATSQSAATFIGGPQQAYRGNLTYLLANLGGLLAVIIVAILFLPAYYRAGVSSVYELIGGKFGTVPQRMASGMFLIGRVFASGARLFIVALPVSLIAFGSVEPEALVTSILIVAVAAVTYTMAGGIRAVIWTDVIQAALYVTTIVLALVLLWQKLPLSITEMFDLLHTADGGSKLKLVDVEFGEDFLARPYTLPAIIIGLTLFNLAAFGTDQDLAQRMLTCRNARSAAWSAILSNIIGWPIVAMFLLMGVLLWIYFTQNVVDPGYTPDDSRTIFLNFILNDMPMGMRGLMLSGLFAASMSSLDSALNAMASSSVADFCRSPEQERNAARERIQMRVFTLIWAAALCGFAIVCVYWQRAGGQTIIDFALGVMVFAYAGLLGVFLTALLTATRGNAWSVCAGMLIGYVCVLLMQPFVMNEVSIWLGLESPLVIAFPWQMTFATLIAFIVCCLGKRRSEVTPT